MVAVYIAVNRVAGVARSALVLTHAWGWSSRRRVCSIVDACGERMRRRVSPVFYIYTKSVAGSPSHCSGPAWPAPAHTAHRTRAVTRAPTPRTGTAAPQRAHRTRPPDPTFIRGLHEQGVCNQSGRGRTAGKCAECAECAESTMRDAMRLRTDLQQSNSDSDPRACVRTVQA